MLTPYYTNQFKKDYKLQQKRGHDIGKLERILTLLAAGQRIPLQNKDHSLKGAFRDYRECHIQPDWLLIYKIDGHHIYFARTGTHADLFE